MEYWANEGKINPTTARARFRECARHHPQGVDRGRPDALRRRVLQLPLPQRVAEAVPEAATEVLHRRHGQRGDRRRSRSTSTPATRSCSCRSRTSCAPSPTSARRPRQGRTVQPDDTIFIVIAYVADTDEEAVREARPHIENFFSWFHRVPPQFLSPPGYVSRGSSCAAPSRPRWRTARARRGTTWSRSGASPAARPTPSPTRSSTGAQEAQCSRVNDGPPARRHARVEGRQEHAHVRRGGHAAGAGARRAAARPRGSWRG